jgi:putative ABC transport system permease protein
MMLLRLLSWQYIRKHGPRSLLTLTGIVFGVAVFVAMHAANQSVFDAFQETINRIAGATELQVTAGESGFDEEYLERVQSLPQVRVAAPVVEAVVSTGLPGQGNLLILGVDMTGDRSLREYDLDSADDAMMEDPLVFLAQPDSIMISTELARRNQLQINGRIALDTVAGSKEFVVRGILRPGGLTRAFGGNIAVMDIYAAQHVFGRGRKFDRIDVALTPGVQLDEARAEIQKALGPGFQVQPPSTRGQSFHSLLRIYNFILEFSSLFALVVGMFIIYNSFSIAVVQRRSEIGILRALGATRRQVAMLFLGESLAGGLVGSVAGLLLGYLVAGWVAASVAGLIEGAYGVARPETRVVLTPVLCVISIGAGLLTSVAAALIPARNAARTDPIKALQKGGIYALSARADRVRMTAAAVLGAGGLFLIVSSEKLPPLYAGYLCVMVAAILLTPRLALCVLSALRPLLRWIRPVEGALAADSLIAAPGRTSATVVALMLSLALVIGLAGAARGSSARILDWVNTTLNPDLFVSSSRSLTDRNYRFPDSMTPELEAIRGVEQVQRVRNVRIDYQRQPVVVMAFELQKVAERSPRRAVEGDLKEMFHLAAEGKGVIASESFATLKGVHVGAPLEIPSPAGLLRLPLVGVIREYSDQQGALIIDREVFKKQWNDDGVNFFRIYLAKGAAPDRVKEAILTRFSGNRRLFVLTNQEARAFVMRLTDQWFRMQSGQIFIAVLVAILGIVSSLTVSITDRRRELGVLQAVGALRSQVRGTIWMEAVAVGLVSLVLGLALGAVHLYCLLEMTARDFPGLRFDFLYPYGVAGLVFPVILLTAWLASLAPAESAVRGSLVEALEYE